jgi:hypothetical protein
VFVGSLFFIIIIAMSVYCVINFQVLNFESFFSHQTKKEGKVEIVVSFKWDHAASHIP